MIDLDDLVRDGLLMESEIRSYNWGADEKDVDYANLFENRFQILKKAFERFDTAKPSFRKFEEDNDCWLADYALFMAVKGKKITGNGWHGNRESETVHRRHYRNTQNY